MPKSVKALLLEAVEAGKRRDYKTSIKILEGLVAQGLADNSSPFASKKDATPEIYLYLSRSWAAEKNYARAIVYGKIFVKRCPNDPAGWFFLGRSFLFAEDFNKAAFCLEKSLSLNNKPLEVRAMLGLAYLKGKKAGLARKVFEDALQFAPTNVKLNTGYLNSLFVEAVHELRNGDVNMASQMLQFVVKNKIDGVAPRLYLAHSLKMQGRLQEALLQYEEACKFAPDDQALKWYPAMIKMELGDPLGASECLSSLNIEIPDDGISSKFFILGAIKKHIETGDFSKAAQSARLYIRNFGSNAEIRLLAAEAHRGMGNVNQALNHYRSALKDEPDNPYPHYGIMLTLQETFRWEELRSEILRAEASGVCDEEDVYYYKIITAAHIDNPPEEVLPHLQALTKRGKPDTVLFNALGETYVKLDMADLALTWYKKTLELRPDDEEALIGLIAVYEAQVADKDLYNAYTTYLAKWDDNLYIKRDFVLFLERSEKWEEAANQLEMLMLQVKKANFEPELARYRRKAGQFQKAAMLYRKMLLAKPEEPMLLHNLAYCLDKMSKTKIAVDLLQASRKIFGLNIETYLIEGILLMRLKKKEDAIRVFQYIIGKDPNNSNCGRIKEFLKRLKK